MRPKGLGLGANKMVANTQAQSVDKNGKELQLVKGAYGKIIAGSHRSQYCQVQGLDDENCRVIVKTALTNEILSLNEFLIVLVTSEEYNKSSRVISELFLVFCKVCLSFKLLDNAKYEEHVEKSRKSRSRSRGEERRSSSSERSRRSKKKRHKKKTKKSKHKSRGSDSENDTRSRRKKNRSRHRSSDSESDWDSRCERKM